ncbi:poly-beta-1,6-N-acetyl-D-glucosamine synthase [Solimicrobium silvestre]|uniref:Poly-beta-1,6-N-acetyl-D-glucosamine synthase n=1 Tax=Solimicrobium silvestre TaxID=2099400 RepID=A0A2S9GSB2_9BURK|nr:Poly-beta-1,6 N-acetyl-D-glucosamine synthase [Solimicrobium silvestre]
MKLDILLFDFTFYYPLFMAYLWMIGGLTYYFRYEHKSHRIKDPLTLLKQTPLVSVIVPCFNEEENVAEVVDALSKLNYPNYEIICVNDGSTDHTGHLLDELTKIYPTLRVIHQAKNQGKAVGLDTAALVCQGEFLLCMDGDAILDRDVIPWMLQHFEEGHRVGAVTGNPRIRTRSTLLGRLQVGEFSSIIGLIKRTQRIYGRIFTVSGVVAMFRRRALLQVGFWSPDMLTEDIDISWKLQTHHWDIRFEPHALCWILMPETLAGLWKQRLRWAMGGIQVIKKYGHTLCSWRMRRMWLIYAEYLTSVFWAYSMALVLIIWSIGLLVHLPQRWQVTIVPGWHGVLIGTTCLLQILVSMLLDRHYDHKIFRHFFWMIWYPLAYWGLNMATTIWAVPRVFIRKRGKRAIWISPDRGLRTPTKRIEIRNPSDFVPPSSVVDTITKDK